VVIPTNKPTVWHDNNTSFTVELFGNTWSRQARRARQHTQSTNPSIHSLSMNQHHSMVDPVLIVRGTIEQTPLSSSWSVKAKETQVTVQLRLDWLQGTDRQLFDSFAAHVFTQIRRHINKQSINVDNKYQ
jgi:hypothetical protein